MKKKLEVLSKQKEFVGMVILILILCVSLVSAAWENNTGIDVGKDYLDEGLVAYWKFDDASGDASDEVTGLYNGTNSGAETAIAGIINSSFNFSTADSDKVTIGDYDAFENHKTYTFSYWVYPISTSFTQWVFEKKDIFEVYHSTPASSTFNSGNNPTNFFGVGVNIPCTECWIHMVATHNGTHSSIYVNGSLINTGLGNGTLGNNVISFVIGARSDGSSSINARIDEFGFWNISLNASAVEDLYWSHTGITYSGAPRPPAEIEINLISPVDNLNLFGKGENFTANYSTTFAGYNFTNTTYYIWNSTGEIFNNSEVVTITGTSNSTTEYIDDFIIGNYEWNVLACWGNATFTNCSFAPANYSFGIGSELIYIFYNNYTYETASETFAASFNTLGDSEISLAQLVYNGTNYTISNITTTATTFNISKTIDISLNANPFVNETRTFFFRFTYGGDQVQETEVYYQNVSFINLQLCNTTYNIQSINFSVKDEVTRILIDPAANSTSTQATFHYWLGGGSEVKNYSFERLNSATNNTYEICISLNKTFKVDMDMVYSAQAYDERTYILRNASITNVTSVIDLFLLYGNLATKFTIEVRQGVSILAEAVVTVARFFVGEGTYRTVSIRKTDSAGQFVEYLDLDNDYRYSIVKNGVLLGVIDKKATCTEAPCEFTLQIAEDIGNIFGGYEDNYARNIFSNLSFDINTKIVTYDFIDITGLAQYFRLRVTQGFYNGTGNEICNQQIFSSSGSMTCNVTGYKGNFVAIGTVSRSPELIDQILEFVLGSLRDSLGLMAIVISFAIILTMTIAGAVLSGGNPSMVLGGFGLGLLATKLMTFLPFSWGLVALFELVILIIMGWLKT